jgi:aldose 1-epimerase
MPVGLGFHPYFIRTPGARLDTSAKHMWQADVQSMPARLVDPPQLAPLDPNAITLDNNFIGWSGHALIRWPEWKARLELRTAGPFECLVLYTPPRQPYFCVEPATNCIDAFNLAAAGRTDTGMLTLEPRAELVGKLHLVPALDG